MSKNITLHGREVAHYRNGVEVNGSLLALDHDVGLAGHDELQVGLIILEPVRPVVNLHASENGVVGLRGVDGLGD